MNNWTALRALLWKEGRENAYKVAAGLAVVLLVHLLRQLQAFNESFAGDADAWGLAVGGLCAAVLAMDAVAGERSRGTLEFLLVRPTTALRILAAKWIVGAAGLLVVVGTFWAMVYATPLTGVTLWNGESAQILADVGWGAMTYAWYLPLLVAYTLVFVASTATENPAEAVGAAVIIGLIGLLVIMFAGYLFPHFAPTRTVVPDFVDLEFTQYGNIVRLANDGDTILDRTVLALGLIAAGVAASAVILSRCHDLTVGWRPMVITAFVLLTAALTVPRLLPSSREIHPVATLEIGSDARGLVLDGAGHAYTFTRDSLKVIDVGDPRQPRSLADAGHRAGWRLSQPVLLDGESLCGLGRLRSARGDSLGVLCFDISDPAAPRPAGAVVVDEEIGKLGIFGFGYAGPLRLAGSGNTLILGAVGAERSTLGAYQVGPQGVRRTDHLVLERYEYPEHTWDGDVSYERNFMLARHAFGLAGAGHGVCVGMHSGLRLIEVSDDGKLRPRGRLGLGDETRFLRFGARQVVVRGDTAWVERLWPREQVVVDVSDPAAPRMAATLPRSARQALDRAAGFYYQVYGQRVSLFEVADPYPRPVPTLTLPGRDRRWGTVGVVLRTTHAYVVMDDVLAVFDLPAREG